MTQSRHFAPRVKRVALILNPASGPVTKLFYRAIEEAAPNVGIETIPIQVHDLADIEVAMSEFGKEQVLSAR